MTDMLLVVQLGGRRAAIPAERVNSVIELTGLTPVPRAPQPISAILTVSLPAPCAKRATLNPAASAAAEPAP